jgi:hypothetical protein
MCQGIGASNDPSANVPSPGECIVYVQFMICTHCLLLPCDHVPRCRFDWMFQLGTVIMFSKRGIDVGRVEDSQVDDRLDALEEVKWHFCWYVHSA